MDEEKKKMNGILEGKPSVPSGAVCIEIEKRKAKSKEFKEFLEKNGEELGLPKGGWLYVMEKWLTPEKKVVKRHYWWHKKIQKSFYHLR